MLELLKILFSSPYIQSGLVALITGIIIRHKEKKIDKKKKEHEIDQIISASKDSTNTKTKQK